MPVPGTGNIIVDEASSISLGALHDRQNASNPRLRLSEEDYNFFSETRGNVQRKVEIFSRSTSGTDDSLSLSDTDGKSTAKSTSVRQKLNKIRVVVRKRPSQLSDRCVAPHLSSYRPEDIINISQRPGSALTAPRGVLVVKQLKKRLDATSSMSNMNPNHFYVQTTPFTCFNNLFDAESGNLDVYQGANIKRDIIDSCVMLGGSGSVFAYGQTGSGKTHTLLGGPQGEKGVYYLAAADVFSNINKAQQRIFVSVYEIYRNQIYDLLSSTDGYNSVHAREDAQGRVQLVGMTKKEVFSPEQLEELVLSGLSGRQTRSTSRNDRSSRSHAIIRIEIADSFEPSWGPGVLNVVDLAGSEKGGGSLDANYDKVSEAERREMRLESADINKSLLCLQECIRALESSKQGISARSATPPAATTPASQQSGQGGQRPRTHTPTSTGGGIRIPFRGCKLTEVLKDSFVGSPNISKRANNDKRAIVMIATVAPGCGDEASTMNTLRYASKVTGLNIDLSLYKDPNTSSTANDNIVNRYRTRSEAECGTRRERERAPATENVFVRYNHATQLRINNLVSRNSPEKRNPLARGRPTEPVQRQHVAAGSQPPRLPPIQTQRASLQLQQNQRPTGRSSQGTQRDVREASVSRPRSAVSQRSGVSQTRGAWGGSSNNNSDNRHVRRITNHFFSPQRDEHNNIIVETDYTNGNVEIVKRARPRSANQKPQQGFHNPRALSNASERDEQKSITLKIYPASLAGNNMSKSPSRSPSRSECLSTSAPSSENIERIKSLYNQYYTIRTDLFRVRHQIKQEESKGNRERSVTTSPKRTRILIPKLNMSVLQQKNPNTSNTSTHNASAKACYTVAPAIKETKWSNQWPAALPTSSADKPLTPVQPEPSSSWSLNAFHWKRAVAPSSSVAHVSSDGRPYQDATQQSQPKNNHNAHQRDEDTSSEGSGHDTFKSSAASQPQWGWGGHTPSAAAQQVDNTTNSFHQYKHHSNGINKTNRNMSSNTQRNVAAASTAQYHTATSPSPSATHFQNSVWGDHKIQQIDNLRHILYSDF